MLNYGMGSNIIKLELPVWLDNFIHQHQEAITSMEERMHLAVELARLNIQHQTGGPFGAVVFDMESHKLVSAGVNLVIPSNCSMAHAEMIAISLAQQKLGTFDLGAKGLPDFELVTSSEPCAMCFGALPWSGIRHLACGAKAEDARRIGFDEGPIPPNWRDELEQRGITVVTDICREEAQAVLNSYAENGGAIYNARQG